MKLVLALTIFLSLPSGSGLLHGQRAAQPVQPVRTYSVVPFDSDADLKGFKGNDPESLYSLLKKNGVIKGEYESPTEWEKKIDQLRNRPLEGSLSIDSLYAFEIDKSTPPRGFGQPVPPTYDADSQLFTATFPTELLNGNDDDSRIRGLVAKRNARTAASSSNATGTTKVVKADHVVSYTLAFTESSLPCAEQSIIEDRVIMPCWMDHLGTLHIPMKVEAMKAKSLKQNFGLIAIAGLVPPYVLDTADHHPPRIDDPHGSDLIYRSVMVRLVALLVYDKATSQVVDRIVVKTPAQKQIDIAKAEAQSKRLELEQTALADAAIRHRESALAEAVTDAQAVVEGGRIDVVSTAWRGNHWEIVLRNRGSKAIAEIQGRISTLQGEELGPLVTLPGFAGPGKAIGGFETRTVDMDGVRPQNPFSTFFIITSWKYLVP